MRLLIAAMLTFAVLSLGSIGCDKNSKQTTAVDNKPGGGSGDGKQDAAKTFTMKTDPAKDVKIKQGDNQKVKIAVVRGKDFNEKIKITLKTKVEGLSFDKADNDLDASTDSVTVSVIAAKDAAPGKFEVTVNGVGGDKTATTIIAGEVTKKE